ncbi:uncharacterized protein DS421_4g133620 [Arachis hypogaea]|nr:uncharacterized protein DS421_4g133620 [Arachis hypogaea]
MRPYNTTKLDYRSQLSVFIDYASNHKNSHFPASSTQFSASNTNHSSSFTTPNTNATSSVSNPPSSNNSASLPTHNNLIPSNLILILLQFPSFPPNFF